MLNPVRPAAPIRAKYEERLTDLIGEMQSAVDRKGITADIKTYPDVGHSFANKLPAQPLLRVASGPTVGQYSEAAGVYTFAVADASAPVAVPADKQIEPAQ